jgi:chorismate mutase
VIQFINELDNLRSEIYLNSKEILELLGKRKELAERIGDVKNSESMNIRNRKREIEILKTLPCDDFERHILNLLFEFSIHYEMQSKINFHSLDYSETIDGMKYIKYSGKRENLMFLLSMIFNPGSVIKCRDKNISETMESSGHHIVDEIENPDIIIKLDGSKQDIIFRNDSLLISERFIENKNRIYNIVIS